MAKTEKPSAIATANEQLTALQVRQEELSRLVADLDRTEPVVRADLVRAERDVARASVRGLYPVPEDVAQRLRDVQERLASLLTRRDEAKAELATLPAKRLDVVREYLPGAWSEYCEAKKAQQDRGFTLSVKVEGLVPEYNRAAERFETAKAGLDRLGKVLGPHFERVLGDRRRAEPEPADPIGTVEREALRRAAELRRLYRGNLH